MATITAGGPLLQNNDQVRIDTGDCAAFSATVTGTFVGTITLQVLYDTTEGWVSAPCFTRLNASITNVLTAPGNRFINAAGTVAVRALFTPYTSGSAECTFCGVPGISVAAAAGGGGGASTIADGADQALGTTTDAGIITDVPGTAIGFLRGAIKMWITFLSRLPAALVNGALVMTGDTAAGAADAGNPLKMGGLAVAHGTNPTAVAAGQRANQAFSRQGLPYVIPGHPNILTSAVTFTAAQTDTVLVTNSAGTKIVLWAYSVKTSDANTVDVSARLGLAATTVPADSATGLVDTHPNIAAGSGFAGGPGIMGIGADAEKLLFTCSVPTGGSIQCAYKWYIVPS